MAPNVLRISELICGGYTEYWNTKKFYRIAKGSKGSGKSFTTAMWYIFNMMKYPLANTLVIRKTQAALQDSVYADLLKAIDKLQVTDQWSHTVSPLRLTYKPTGQKILFKGLDDPSKLASITAGKGYLCWVWFEEMFEITSEADFEKIVMSIRGYIPPETGLFKQITGTFNPWSQMSWIKKRFFDEPHDNVFAITTTYRTNQFLDPVSDIPRYEELSITNPRLARIVCDGDWGRAEGQVYTNWEEQDFNINDILAMPGVEASYGLDFGYSTSHNGFIAVLVNPKAHTLWIFDEVYERRWLNMDIAKKLCLSGYGKEGIIADCAEPKSIAELQAGLFEEVIKEDGTTEYIKWSLPSIRPALKGRDSLNNGIQRLQSFKMYVHPKCVNTIMELTMYVYATDKFGNPTDEPADEFNHLMDALRYACEKFFMRSHGRVVEAKGEQGTKQAVRSKRVVSSAK